MPVVYRVDFVCFDAILVELKALPAIGPLGHSQVINYLKASKLERALILNFGARSFQFKRSSTAMRRSLCRNDMSNPRKR